MEGEIHMQRRELLKQTAALGLMSALPTRFFGASPAAARSVRSFDDKEIPVAFVISEGAVVIDFAGPWEMFGAAMPTVDGKMTMPFQPYMVAETSAPVKAGGGLQIVPDYTFSNAPAPKIIVIPAQNDSTGAMIEWIRHASQTADLTMSVCTGAFVLAKTGLLSGKKVTTHHGSCFELSQQYPDIHVLRGVRYVEDGKIASSGGLSCGIDLALHVVERYFGRQTATETAFNEEYQSKGWLHPEASSEFAHFYIKGQPMCPVCGMTVNVSTAPKSVYKGETYYCCMAAHKRIFDAIPEQVLAG
jgi:putative intracellular protease/amidase/YHS domain-containing protein